MIGGLLHINGAPVEKQFAGNRMALCDGRPAEIPTYRETLPNGVTYIVDECFGDDAGLDNVGPYQVPEGHFFMMGDNRDQSQDSRVLHMVGYVPMDDIVGKAERLFFSVDGEKTRVWEVWKWPFAIRYGRIFDPVE
jgi:signal peptidase I